MPFPPKNINVWDIEEQQRQELDKIYNYYKYFILHKICPNCNEKLSDHEYDSYYGNSNPGTPLLYIDCNKCGFQVTNDANVDYNKPKKPKPSPIRIQLKNEVYTSEPKIKAQYVPENLFYRPKTKKEKRPKINIFKYIFDCFYRWEDRRIEQNVEKMLGEKW